MPDKSTTKPMPIVKAHRIISWTIVKISGGIQSFFPTLHTHFAVMQVFDVDFWQHLFHSRFMDPRVTDRHGMAQGRHCKSAYMSYGGGKDRTQAF